MLRFKPIVIGLTALSCLAVVLVGSGSPQNLPSEMVLVPAGFCQVGSSDAGTQPYVSPARRIYLDAFAMDRCEVTNLEYARFDPTHRFAKGSEQRPVTHKTISQARAYLASRGKRLPSFYEWEKAARGTDGRRYPWGNQWNPQLAHVGDPTHRQGGCTLTRMQPVGQFPLGASPSGCLDMCGNAWEWVEGRPTGLMAGDVIRGGAYSYPERECRCYAFSVEDPGIT